jgi:AmiR/NasT family two-component response regulator
VGIQTGVTRLDDLHERVAEAKAQAEALQRHLDAMARSVEVRLRAAELRDQAAVIRAEREHYRNLIDELRDLVENLNRALDSRAGIEQAKGVIMAMQRCTPDEAFDFLREVSQRSNRKLVAVAAEVVERAQRAGAPAADR